MAAIILVTSVIVTIIITAIIIITLTIIVTIIINRSPQNHLIVYFGKHRPHDEIPEGGGRSGEGRNEGGDVGGKIIIISIN